MKPSDPHDNLIKSYELETAAVSERIRYLESREKSRENDLREERLKHDKKLGYLQLLHYSRATVLASCIGVLGLIGVTIYNHVNAVKVDPEINKELILMTRDIKRTGIETRKTVQTDHNLANELVSWVRRMYCKDFPDRCPNAFGNYNKKGK